MNSTEQRVGATEETDLFDRGPSDESSSAAAEEIAERKQPRERGRLRRIRWARLLAFGILPGIALLLALVAGYAKWVRDSARIAETSAMQSVQAAKDGTVAMLAYNSKTVESDLNSARDRLTGEFRNSYTTLINDMVIPGSKEKDISAAAEVPAAGIVSVDGDHSVVLVYVDQTTTIKKDPPTKTASSVRVTLDRVDGRWLISGFDPV
jgi:Mce-associated membrane protein